MICPICNTNMKLGIALKTKSMVGVRTIVPQPFYYMKTPDIISCMKCPKCGYSDDDVIDAGN